jgi:hypothetical protein
VMGRVTCDGENLRVSNVGSLLGISSTIFVQIILRSCSNWVPSHGILLYDLLIDNRLPFESIHLS